MERFSYPGDTPQLLSVPYHGTKRCLYLHQWMNATTRLKSSMKRFDNFKWCSTKTQSSHMAGLLCFTDSHLSVSDSISALRGPKNGPPGAKKA